MSLLDRFLDRQPRVTQMETAEQRQVRAVADFEKSCERLRGATKPIGQFAPQDQLWQEWQANADRLRELGIDPILYANARRG